MSVKELNISPVGRVEGDLDVKVYIDNGKVTRAHTQAAMFRGFEKIMEGKDPQSGLIVTPRICGICGVCGICADCVTGCNSRSPVTACLSASSSLSYRGTSTLSLL